MSLLLIALAGGLGATTRFVTDSLIARHNPFRVPLGTLVVNVTGSLLLGILVGALASAPAGSAGQTAVAVIGTGFCGGYTTFSTASVEVARLLLAEGRVTGVGYAAATLIGSVLAAGLGIGLGGALG